MPRQAFTTLSAVSKFFCASDSAALRLSVKLFKAKFSGLPKRIKELRLPFKSPLLLSTSIKNSSKAWFL
ncbi:hypothetical protein EON65_04650 [archaeon]|nr:MAG: hypothetical protein EON65_04650 [archaeon]